MMLAFSASSHLQPWLEPRAIRSGYASEMQKEREFAFLLQAGIDGMAVLSAIRKTRSDDDM